MISRNDLKDVRYLGDGAYMGHDGFQIWVFTSNGIFDCNFVAMEPVAVERLHRYMREIEQLRQDCTEDFASGS